MSRFIPNSFQVPNAFIDDVLTKISGNACKIYLLIIRKTRGWNKEADRISYSQIQKLTGIGSSATVDKAVSELVDLGLIFYKKGNEKSANEYRLNDDFCTSKNEVGGTSKNEDTEIQSFKNTKQKTKSEYDTHTHESQDFENLQNQPKSKTAAKNSKSDNSSANQKKPNSRLNPNGIEKPAELDAQIWLDFLKIKKQRTKEDLSVTAWNRFFNQVLLVRQKTNHSLNEVFGYWIGETNWKGFNSDWYLSRLNNQPQNYQNTQNRKDEFRDPKWDSVFGDNFYGNNQAIGE